jgi:hypothetical protein
MLHSVWSPYCSYCCDGPCDCESCFNFCSLISGRFKRDELNIQNMLANMLQGCYFKFSAFGSGMGQYHFQCLVWVQEGQGHPLEGNTR